jgi:hypothetical protein
MNILQSTREWTYYSQPGNGHISQKLQTVSTFDVSNESGKWD